MNVNISQLNIIITISLNRLKYIPHMCLMFSVIGVFPWSITVGHLKDIHPNYHRKRVNI